jgi:hypothetical protein
MELVEYFTICHDCGFEGGMPIIYINDTSINTYVGLREFDIMLDLEQKINENSHRCDFCGSVNALICDISINGKKVFNVNKFENYRQDATVNQFYFQFNFEENENGNYFKTSGSQFAPNDFHLKSINKIKKLIIERPISHFNVLDNAKCSILISGKIIQNEIDVLQALKQGWRTYINKPDLHYTEIQIEHFKCYGLSKYSILSVLEEIENKY